MDGSTQRELIVDTAHGKFLRFGIRRVSMDEIARDLRISKKTLYAHFTSKQDLVAACTNKISQAVLPQAKAALSSDKPTAEKLIALWQAFAGLPSIVSAELLGDLKADYPLLWREVDARRKSLLAGLEDIVSQGIREGAIRPEIHPRVLMRLVMAVLDQVMTPEAFAQGGFAPSDAVRTVINVFSRGVLVDAAGIEEVLR